jgi:Fe-Mn family superoxide dismutase
MTVQKMQAPVSEPMNDYRRFPMEVYLLPKLPFPYDALEPYIDKKTMHVHHKGHHKAYVEKLNSILEPYPQFQKPVEELLLSLNELPSEIQEGIRNNAGGHANHSFFWSVLTPKHEKNPPETFLKVMENTFGSFVNFKEKFAEVAVDHFSNGWAWLCADGEGTLRVLSTKDHENPICQGMTPLLVLDLWEHAYYLSYQNKRAKFIEAFWKIVNWYEVEARWKDFQGKGSSPRVWRLAG